MNKCKVLKKLVIQIFQQTTIFVVAITKEKNTLLKHKCKVLKGSFYVGC